MPAYKARERLMLRALHRYGSGQEGCIRGWLSLPHSMRVFYLHSYCSRVWNEAAKYRLQTLGFKPVQGDLVWAGSEKRPKDTTEELNTPQVRNFIYLKLWRKKKSDGLYTHAHYILDKLIDGNTNI